ncbi:MAG: amidohydrolase family protein, partial [Gallionella sp.]|nr:amidohydrolase family protein [Gallionella sp.]
VKLSAIDALSQGGYPFKDMWSMLRKLFDKFGPSRLLWGSDWPHVRNGISYESCHMPIREALSAVSDGDMQIIFRDTARRAFPTRPNYSQGMES